jgi:hypothetical protein
MGNTSSSDVYSDAASFGKISVVIKLIMTIIVAIALVVLGVYLYRRKNVHTKSLDATITDANCTTESDGRSTTYNCKLTLEYTINNKKYSGINISTDSSSLYNKGNTITIYYDPNNPTDISLFSKGTQQTIGEVIIVIAILSVIFGILSWWLASRSKFYAASQGVGTAYDLIRN